MQEFKRERNTLETRINDLTKRATYHDDHLRVIDAWLSQVSAIPPDCVTSVYRTVLI